MGPAPPNPFRVLLVDDEPDILTSLREVLEGEFPGIQVFTAESGRQALRIMEQEPIELLITDYKMPGMDGFEFLARAERLSPMIPRIMVTAFAVDVPTVSREIFRVEHFFSKPVAPDDIVRALRAELARRPA